MTFSLACACGTWRGALAADSITGARGVCYCDDCQAYARFLGRDDTMNAAGGTEVIQTWPAQLTVTAGANQLRLMRLTPKGLHRWYLACCRSASGGVPPGAHRTASLGVISGAASLLARGWWRGAHRPSLFFGEDGKPVVEAEIASG